ncbi:DUF4433 domain-containing protein [Larkinella humicola]|uniref:DUF4433 domain-containing protein n=2 Tax=Larkinella humicola TaxID=2607654 RepID=A0A5N1JKG5_9BACT|nr:DUF4433 domain-containing protein [Larkinella humicola]
MSLPSPIWIYRMTHLANLPYLLKHGLVTRHSPVFSPDYLSIGENTLIQERAERQIPVPPHGLFSEYISFYFGHRSPMLYQIITGWEGVTKVRQEDIVYLVSSLQKLQQQNSVFVFTDGHAASRLTRFFTNWEDLSQVDWDVITSTDWKNTEDDPDRQRRKQAEVLIYQQVPIATIEFLLTYTTEKRQIVLDLVEQAGLTIPVRVSTKAYYDRL